MEITGLLILIPPSMVIVLVLAVLCFADDIMNAVDD